MIILTYYLEMKLLLLTALASFQLMGGYTFDIDFARSITGKTIYLDLQSADIDRQVSSEDRELFERTAQTITTFANINFVFSSVERHDLLVKS